MILYLYRNPEISGHKKGVNECLGSAWSNDTELITIKRRRSYLNGTWFPCHATTSSGEWSADALNSSPCEQSAE